MAKKKKKDIEEVKDSEEAVDLKEAEDSNEGVGDEQQSDGGDVKKASFPDFENENEAKGANPLSILNDVALKVVVELGRTVLTIEEILELGIGSIIELDKVSGDPVEILVNRKLIAKGEVVVIDEDFGVRITDVMLDKKKEKAN